MNISRCDYFIPEDLQIEILPYLPVKSLLRFRCVCKSWFTMLKTPAFISKHFVKFNSVDDHRRMLAYCHNSCFQVLSYNTFRPVDEYLGHLYRIVRRNMVTILGTFNGVVCLHDRGVQKIVFWNPATRERKDFYQQYPSSDRWIYGFCYDFRTNDYKIVKICMEGFMASRCKVMVFALSTCSWRKINVPFPEGYSVDSFSRSVRICLNGIFSVLVYRRDGLNVTQRELPDCLVLSLYMSKDVPIVTPVIEDLNFAGCTPYLIALNNSVALIKQIRLILGAIKMDISVLDEYGPNGTWTKLYTLGPLSNIERPLEFWGNDALLLKRRNEELVLYDLKTRELKSFRAGCQPQPLRLLEYKESLVPVLLKPSPLLVV